ncbi:MAG: hypothetical protein E7E80_05970 [Cutibacterium avidum]|nr:hypothetical protein [Cutibacterium avidum]MDU3283387.1 hypothetical protein [Cutibacterium avidum]MDU3750009.1 hypothetical protein [Cutibacterium avidum]
MVLVLTEVELPDLVRTRGWRGEGGLALLGHVPALFLVASMEQEAFVGHDPQHRRRRKPVPLVTDHGPDLAMTPDGMLAGHRHHSLPVLVA